MPQPSDQGFIASSYPPNGARPPEDEIVYYEGRPRLRADQTKAAVGLLIGIVLFFLPIAGWIMNWGWPWWAGLLCMVAAVAIVVVPWLLTHTTRYRITNYRIDFERGILTKKIDTLELWHVDDIRFEQGLLDRMLNVGCVIVMSNDKTTPRLDLHGLPNPRKIFDALKERVIAVKRQRGVLKMDVG